MITLKNSFHRTETRVRMTPSAWGTLVDDAIRGNPDAERKVKRIRRRLCPSGCTCSLITGERS